MKLIELFVAAVDDVVLMCKYKFCAALLMFHSVYVSALVDCDIAKYGFSPSTFIYFSTSDQYWIFMIYLFGCEQSKSLICFCGYSKIIFNDDKWTKQIFNESNLLRLKP